MYCEINGSFFFFLNLLILHVFSYVALSSLEQQCNKGRGKKLKKYFWNGCGERLGARIVKVLVQGMKAQKKKITAEFS